MMEDAATSFTNIDEDMAGNQKQLFYDRVSLNNDNEFDYAVYKQNNQNFKMARNLSTSDIG